MSLLLEAKLNKTSEVFLFNLSKDLPVFEYTFLVVTIEIGKKSFSEKSSKFSVSSTKNKINGAESGVRECSERLLFITLRNWG